MFHTHSFLTHLAAIQRKGNTVYVYIHVDFTHNSLVRLTEVLVFGGSLKNSSDIT